MKIAVMNDLNSANASYAETLTRKEALVYDLRAIVNGEHRYFIIKIMPAKQTAFLQAVDKDAGLRLEDYGDILHRGWDEPEDDLKALLKKQYGMQYPEEEAGTLKGQAS